MKRFPLVVEVKDTDPNLVPTYRCLGWLNARKLRDDRDFRLDMHGGQLGRTSFYFRDAVLAVEFKLMFG